MRTLSIINLKGGVAKTVTAINFAYILSKVYGYRVLVLDNDKQGDASRQLRRRNGAMGIAEVMTKRSPNMRQIIQRTEYANLDIVSADMRLLKANMEVMLDQTRTQQNRIERALQQVKGLYDFCIIDNAPDINISTINALVASDDVIVPIEIDDNTTEGLPELLEQIDNTREDLNQDLMFRGCLITKYDRRNDAHVQGAEILRGYNIFKTVIRTTPKVAESTFAQEPVYTYSRRSAAAMDYGHAVAEYLQMLNKETDSDTKGRT